MANVAVVELLGNRVRPVFEFGCVDLDDGPAGPTGQMVVVRVDDAPAVETLAPVGHDHVDVTRFDESFQLRVHGGEGDLAAVLHNELVQILSADEASNPTKNANHFTALCGISCRGHDEEPTGADLLSRMVLSSIIGMILKKALITGAVAFVIAVFVFMVTLALVGTRAASKPLIVSGVSQWGTLARQLVGPDARVVTLITDPNADPHQHEATVADAANVSGASLVVLNGAGYDTWLSQLVATRSSPVATINVASLMGVATGKNPHLFYDPRAAIRFVETMSSELRRRSGFATIVPRSKALLANLNALQRSALAIRRSCAGVPVAATEDVSTYLLDDMGLTVVTPESLRLAVGNGVDPSVSDLALALDQLSQHPAFLIDNIQTATPLTNEIVAKARRSRVPVIKVTETMTGTNYVSWLDGVVHSIHQALVKEGCVK